MATTPDPNKGSEYGGVPGRVQPPPHDVADWPSEILGRVYATNKDGVVSDRTSYVPDPDDPFVPDTGQIRR